jgi:uncharacterized protein (TIGR02246 family)
MPKPEARGSASSDDVIRLYEGLLDAWNRGDADGYAARFAPDGNLVGFDGSTVDGRAAVGEHLSGIFGSHQTAAYVAAVREVRFLSSDCALLRAAVGMVPPGENDINPATNAIQSLVAVADDERTWHVALFHNTPAAFHGRPEAADELTEELRSRLGDLTGGHSS